MKITERAMVSARTPDTVCDRVTRFGCSNSLALPLRRRKMSELSFIDEYGDWDRATILAAVAIHSRLFAAGFVDLRWDELGIDDTDFFCVTASEAITAYDSEMHEETE